MNDPSREQALRLLRDAWKERRLVLFLGAGVSMGRGLPSWTALLVDLIAHNTDRLTELWPNYREAVARWIAQSRDFTPLSLAAGVKQRFAEKGGRWTRRSQMAYLRAVQKALYPSGRQHQAPSGNDSLHAVAELIQRSERNGRNVAAVVTTNFDDFLEKELRDKQVPHAVVHDGKQLAVAGKLPIMHIHGFIPERPETVSHQEIVFAEDEYHELTYDMFHWALVELVHLLRSATVLFVGFSMTDPNVRRLLEATRDERTDLRHVAILLDSQNVDPGKIHEEIHHVAIGIDPRYEKTPPQLARHVGRAVHAAKDYEQAILRRLGVTVWRTPSKGEVVKFLGAIGRGAGSRRVTPRARAASSRRSRSRSAGG